ncbi:MAG: efflux RND transporter permease subunit [Candidatus Aerophobetes bacterium]
MSLSRTAIRRPISTFMVFLAVLVLGGFSLKRIAIDLYPDITFPVIMLMTGYEGAAPLEVEKMVTEPLEKMVSTVNNIKEVSSVSSDGVSVIIMNFDWGANMDEVANDVRERVSLVKGALPEGADDPLAFKFDPSLMPLMVLSLSGDRDLVQLRYLADEDIRYELEQIEGVASIEVTGGKEREIQVQVDRSQLASVDLSLGQLINALRTENLNLPGGYVESSEKEFFVRTMGEFNQVSQIENVVIANKGGVPIYLRDVAQVKDTFKEQRTEIRVNGKSGIIMVVRKQSGTNTVRVADRIHEKLTQIGKDLPQGVEVGIIFDTSRFIKDSIFQLAQMAILGAIIAIIIIFLFFGNIPSGLIIFSAIPLSIMVAFILMHVSHLTLNMMTLGGLALGVGMMVDSAIVVLENIFRHREEGKSIGEAAVAGSDEVGMAITASILTTLVVFLSLLFTTGIASIFFKHLAYTVAFALLSSLFVALTLIPVLCSKYLSVRSHRAGEERIGFSRRISGYVEERYQGVLGWALGHRKTVIASAVAILIASFLLAPRIGTRFMPAMDEGRFSVDVQMPVGTRLALTDEISREVEEKLRENTPELESLLAQVGATGGMMGFSGGASHKASLTVKLVDLSQRKRSTREIVDSLRGKLKTGEATVRFGGGDPGEEMLFGGSPIALDIKGYDLTEGKRLAQEVFDSIRKVKGVVEPRMSLEEGQPELQVRIDRDKASSLGLNFSQIAQTIRTANAGTVASWFREGGNEYNILVRLQAEDREGPADLGKIFIASPLGRQIPLDSVAWIEEGLGPVQIERKEQERVITVSGGIKGRDLGSVTRDIKETLADIRIPEGFLVEFGGEQQEMAESFRSLFFALILAVVLVYMVMASQFESLRYPFVIMLALPFAAIGVILILFLSGTIFTVVVYIGLIMLAGIVVNNGIVMISYINILRERGLALSEAVRMGARRRLRPILMTTFTTVFALLPMALGLGAGAGMWAPMARTVIGGLLSSFIFTLILVPTLYTIFAGKKARGK